MSSIILKMGLFNLRWNNHISNILQVFVENLSSESLVDVTLSCEGRFIKAHKIILSACSPYFQELFSNHNSKHPVVILNGIKYEDLQSIIAFMYNGEIKVEESELIDLLSVAETLQVKGLCNIREKNDQTDCPSPSPENAKKPDRNRVLPDLKESRKRRKMSKTMDELGKEAIFVDQEKMSQDSEIDQRFCDSTYVNNNTDINFHNPVQRTDNPQPDNVIPRQKKKLDNKDKLKSETQGAIFGYNSTEKIRRPPNAFMVFANEWRRKLAFKYPADSNTEISVRLGTMWKSLNTEEKSSYYALSKKADEEHKIKYPGYYYSPKEARMRKNMKQDLMMSKCLPPSVKNIDALRFVKVFMNGNDRKDSSHQLDHLNIMNETAEPRNVHEKRNGKIINEDNTISTRLMI